MSDNSDSSRRFQLSSLLDGGALVRLGGIGAVIMFLAGCFAFVGGWLSPDLPTQARRIDAFERVDRDHPGFRCSQAKGLCIEGSFESNGQSARPSGAAVLAAGRSRPASCSGA